MSDAGGDGGQGSGSGKEGSRGVAPGRFKKPAEPAVVALRMEDLALWAVERAAKFPREHKFTIGDRWVEACLDVTTFLVEASYTRDRGGLLRAASHALTRARVLVRMAQRLRLLSADQRTYFAEQSVEIGRMIGGWAGWTRGQADGRVENAG